MTQIVFLKDLLWPLEADFIKVKFSDWRDKGINIKMLL